MAPGRLDSFECLDEKAWNTLGNLKSNLSSTTSIQVRVKVQNTVNVNKQAG